MIHFEASSCTSYIDQEPLNVLSFGAGVQSTTLLFMACLGQLPKPDAVIFADTGWESEAIYNHLEYCKRIAFAYDIHIDVVSNGNIRDDLLQTDKRTPSVPFYTLANDGSKGLAWRQCTKEYKINPVMKAIREKMGYKPRERIKKHANLWLGISMDEVERMKPSQIAWLNNTYPLIDKLMNRNDCISWLKRNGFIEPPKSSCIGCPYHNNHYWLDMKRNDPKSWEDAVLVDKEIRHHPKFNSERFLHKDCIPLDQVNLNEDQLEFDFDYFTNECEGHCGL